MSLSDYTIDAVTYTQVENSKNDCEGCIASTSEKLCASLNKYCKYKVWVIKEGNAVQDYIAAIDKKYPEEDAVNPKHYDLFPEYGIQVRELMQVLCDKLDKQGYSGFLCSDYVQAMQYFLRWFEKNGADDIKKGIWYMNKILEQLKEKE